MNLAADVGALLQLVPVQRAGFALLLASVGLPVIGVVIVGLDIMPVRFAMMHVALLGIAVGLMTGLDPLVCALVACALSGAAVTPLARTPSGLSGAMGLLMSLAIAAALLLLSVSGVNASGAFSLLWGSILSVGTIDLVVLGSLAVVVPALFWWRRRDLALLLHDRELAQCSGVPVGSLTLVLLVLVAVSVAGAITLTGALLVDALTLLPALAAHRLGKSLKSIVLWAMAIGVTVNVTGFLVALWLDWPPGPVLVLTAGAVVLAVQLLPERSSRSWRSPESVPPQHTQTPQATVPSPPEKSVLPVPGAPNASAVPSVPAGPSAS
ncbi:metal ABC transporter permease [Streptomyces sp. NPDC058171]